MPANTRLRQAVAIAALLVLAAAIVIGCTTGSGGGQQAAATTISTATGNAASGAPSTAASGEATPGAPAVTLPTTLIGTWTVNVSTSGPTPGVWTLRATAHDLELRNPKAGPDEFFSINPIRVSDTEIDLGEDAECEAARYTWRVTGDQLVLSTAADSCGDRHVILTAGAWSRQP